MTKERPFTEEETNKSQKSKKISAIDTDQLEYTAEKIFTYSTILVAVVGVYLAVGYTMGKKLTS